MANPTKPKAIADILLRNREKLIDFLNTFHTDRTDDEQFNDEKAYLIKQISELKEIKAWTNEISLSFFLSSLIWRQESPINSSFTNENLWI